MKLQRSQLQTSPYTWAALLMDLFCIAIGLWRGDNVGYFILGALIALTVILYVELTTLHRRMPSGFY